MRIDLNDDAVRDVKNAVKKPEWEPPEIPKDEVQRVAAETGRPEEEVEEAMKWLVEVGEIYVSTLEGTVKRW